MFVCFSARSFALKMYRKVVTFVAIYKFIHVHILFTYVKFSSPYHKMVTDVIDLCPCFVSGAYLLYAMRCVDASWDVECPLPFLGHLDP